MCSFLSCVLIMPLRRLCPRRNNTTNNVEEETPIPFVIPISSGNVIKVYDGDTITIQFRLPYKESP